MWFIDSTEKLRRALVDIDGHIQIDVLSTPISALIGEVQAAPTTYTVLDRLKTLATLLNAGLPSALDTGALKVREQNPLASINVGNWPTDFPDAGVAKLLAGGLPSALTSDKLKVRASEIETLLGAGLPALLDTGALKVREQNPLTGLTVDITKILGTAVSLTNYLPVGVIYPAGTLINPQSIRALTAADVVSATLTEPVVTGARGKTTIIKAGGANNSTNNFYTVTAGKTFYLVGGVVTANINAAALNGIWYVQVDTGGDGTFRTFMYGDFFTSAAGGADRAHVTCPLTLAVPLPFPALTVFRCVSNAVAVEVYPTVWGWEE